MNSITVNFKNTCSLKPTTKEQKVRESNNTSTTIHNIDPLTFAELMMQGRTWCPAIFKNGRRSNDNWIGQSVFALDFDSGVQPNLMAKRAYQNGLIPNVVYTSFSDSPELRKFRIVFFMNSEIKDATKAKELQLTLMELFPEADISCKDYARMFFAAKEVLYVDDNINDIFEVAKLVLARRERLNTGFFGKQDEHKQDEQDVKGQYGATLLPSQKVVCCGGVSKSIRKLNKKNFNFDKAIERIEILRDLVEGTWLYHNELFGLATNLKYINGGLDLMKEVMIEANRKGTASYSHEKFEMLEQVRKSNYKSQRLAQFSQYPDDHRYKNVFEACI